jgi:hypothetical protein
MQLSRALVGLLAGSAACSSLGSTSAGDAGGGTDTSGASSISAGTDGSVSATGGSGGGSTATSGGSSATGTGSGSTGGSSGGGSSTGGGPVCGAIETFETGKSPTASVHVDPAGSDGAGCGAVAMPCATLEYAASLAMPGTAVVLHQGTYAPDAWIEGLQGTIDAPIWIGGAAGEARPVISGGGQAFQLREARYVVIHDLEVTAATANGINADDGSSYGNPEAARWIVFRDLYVHDIGQGANEDCLKLSGLNDFWVLDSTFERCGAGGSGVDHVGCHQGLLVGNTFRETGSNGVQAKGGSADLEIRGNSFFDAGQRAVNLGGSTGFEFFRPPLDPANPNAEATDIRLVANLITGGETPFAFVGCDGCLALNNTIVDPGTWLMRILQETTTTPEWEFVPARGGVVQNNVFWFDRSALSTWVNIGADTDPASFSFVNNLWYAHDDAAQSDPAADLPSVEVAGLYGQDPLFIDLALGDLHLAPGSPAIATGAPQGALTHDRDGACWADPPSRGAFEGG